MKELFTDGEKKIFIENLYEIEKPLRFRPATDQEIKNHNIKMERKRTNLERRNKLKNINKL